MGLGWLWKCPYFLHDWSFKVISLKEKRMKWRRSHRVILHHKRRSFLPEPSLFLYRIPLIFRHLTGSSLSYTDGSQLYLVPVFSWTDVKGVGGDCGPLKKRRERWQQPKGTVTIPSHWIWWGQQCHLVSSSRRHLSKPLQVTQCTAKNSDWNRRSM